MDEDKMMEKLARGARMFQERAEKMKAELKNQRAEGEAGGGWVRAVVNGEHRVLRVEIADEAMADKAMLQDLVAAAVSEANRKVDEKMADQMRGDLAANLPDLASDD